MLLVLVFCLLSILHFTQVLASGQALTNHGRKGAVASLAADCTEIGIDLMKKGGNAADAVRRLPAPVLRPLPKRLPFYFSDRRNPILPWCRK